MLVDICYNLIHKFKFSAALCFSRFLCWGRFCSAVYTFKVSFACNCRLHLSLTIIIYVSDTSTLLDLLLDTPLHYKLYLFCLPLSVHIMFRLSFMAGNEWILVEFSVTLTLGCKLYAHVNMHVVCFCWKKPFF